MFIYIGPQSRQYLQTWRPWDIEESYALEVSTFGLLVFVARPTKQRERLPWHLEDCGNSATPHDFRHAPTPTVPTSLPKGDWAP